MSDATEWLASIGLEQYAEAFSENDIGFDLLTSLDHEVLQANLARIYLARGETELAQKSIEAGNSLIKQGGDSWGGPELARVRADLMLANEASTDSVDGAYREALMKAKDYPNKFYELRSACGFAQHYISTGRAKEACELLSSACESVTEPCDNPDFVAAKNLLSQQGES